MKKIFLLIVISYFTLSCTKDIINTKTSHADIFQSFWEIMDEHYVFFKEKKVNWDSVYAVYQPKFKTIVEDSIAIANYQKILNIIKDKHVSVFSNKREFAYVDKEKETPFLSKGKMYYRYEFYNFKELENLHLAQLSNNIAYIHILPNDFSHLSGANIGLEHYNFTNGLIVDLRDCTGGYSDGLGICDLFFSGQKTITYAQHKTGKDHNEFSELIPIRLKGLGIIPGNTPIILLINNNTYSMGNIIASIIKDITNCTIIGEKTGGGGGAVQSIFLPKGWGLAYTCIRTYNLSFKLIEDGIKPDIEVVASKEFWKEVHNVTGEDPQLEKAIELLKEKQTILSNIP